MQVTENGFKLPNQDLRELQVQNSHLKAINSPEEAYKCGLCFIGFRSKDLLLAHLREEHWTKASKMVSSPSSYEFKVENQRNRVNIIKEGEVFKTNGDKMIFNTNPLEKVKLEENGDHNLKTNSNFPLLKQEEGRLPSEEITRASTKKEEKPNFASAELTPVKLNERTQKNLRRTTPSSPYSQQRVYHQFFILLKISI